MLGNRVSLTLVAPEDELTVRALEVLEPFGLGRAQRYPLAELAADLDATLRRDAVARVERDDRIVRLQSGDELRYDVLVLAVGAFPYPAYEHGICFARPSRRRVRRGRRRSASGHGSAHLGRSPTAPRGSDCRGVPCDRNGFILVDGAFHARDTHDLYAVGDATAGSSKQGGLAAQ